MPRRRRRALPDTNTEDVPHTGTIRDAGRTRATRRAPRAATQRRYNRGRKNATMSYATTSCPVQLVPTTPRRHITESTALNIPATYRVDGDWHQHSTWFSHRPESLDDRDLTGEQTHGRLLNRLGQWGLHDARKGLAELGHPGADYREKAWAATHDRAVLEESWKLLTRRVRTGETPSLRPVRTPEAPAVPRPVDPPAMVGLATAGTDDTSGTRAVGPMAQGMVAVVAVGQKDERYPAIALKPDEREREELMKRLGNSFHDAMDAPRQRMRAKGRNGHGSVHGSASTLTSEATAGTIDRRRKSDDVDRDTGSSTRT